MWYEAQHIADSIMVKVFVMIMMMMMMTVMLATMFEIHHHIKSTIMPITMFNISFNLKRIVEGMFHVKGMTVVVIVKELVAARD